MTPDVKQSLRDAVENNIPGSLAEHREFFKSLADQLNAIGLSATAFEDTAGLFCKSDQEKACFRICMRNRISLCADFEASHSEGYSPLKPQKTFKFFKGRERARDEIIQTIGHWIANNASERVIQKILPDRKPVTAPALKLDI